MAISIPLQFADLLDQSPPLLVADQISNVAFAVDLVINFFTGYLDVKARLVVLDRRRVQRNYLRSWFLADLLATIPFDVSR